MNIRNKRMNQQNLYSGYKNDKICFMAVIVFLMMPIMGIIMILAANLSRKRTNKRMLVTLFVLLACYLGAINATKIPVSDQWNYWLAYKEVPQMGFVGSLHNIYGSYSASIYGESSKEMGFGVLNYVGYYLTFGCYPLFILLFTALLYFALFYAIFEYFTETSQKLVKEKILSGVLTIAFFTQYFNLTIHLQRQEIATVLMMLAIIQYIVREHKNWILIIIALSLHTSVVMFMPVFFFGHHIANKSKKWLFYILLGIIFLFFSMVSIAQAMLSQYGLDFYVLERAANAGNSSEERMETGLVMALSLPMLWVSVRKIFFQRNFHVQRERILFFLYTIIAVFVFITPDNTLQYRFFMLTYVFIPFIFPQIFEICHVSSLNRCLLFFIPFFMFIRFYVTFEDIVFDYAPVEYVIFDNFISLLTYRVV